MQFGGLEGDYKTHVSGVGAKTNKISIFHLILA